MFGQYTLDGHTPVLATDLLDWALWFETADRTVARTQIEEGVEVSTVFLGLDHCFGMSGPPILFETMIFGGPKDGEQARYATWDEAVAGHRPRSSRPSLPNRTRTMAPSRRCGS